MAITRIFKASKYCYNVGLQFVAVSLWVACKYLLMYLLLVTESESILDYSSLDMYY